MSVIPPDLQANVRRRENTEVAHYLALRKSGTAFSLSVIYFLISGLTGSFENL